MVATDTSRYKLNHTMIRIKDPRVTIDFYKTHFGLSVVNQMDFPEAKFSLYFLAFDSEGAESQGKHWTDREGILELTHNFGTENDDSFKANTGNAEPHRGFGHIAFSVDHIQAACAALESAGVKFQKRLTDGFMKNIAFALDPDGYWVEIIAQPGSDSEAEMSNKARYRFNHSMIRVKDPEKSIQFYRCVLGMSLLRTIENKGAKFNLYFLGYRHGDGKDEEAVLSNREGLVELTWNYTDFKYHNGNDQPQGFGHLCITVDDLDAACARFEDLQVNWKKRLTDGRMKSVAFILDPDNYWIEVIQNEGLEKHAGW